MGKKESKEAPPDHHQSSSSSEAKAKPPPQAAAAKASKAGIPLLPRAADGWRLPPRYQVHKSIGKGSYGSVSEAYDQDKKVSVAVKQLRGLFEDLVDCKRILRETAILCKLDSDRVVRVHDIVIPEGVGTFNELYIVLEICDSDMKKLVKQDVSLKAQHINTLLYNLLVGLKYIHSAGVYHRDLKPANCLVNQDCSVKICDFGLARAVGRPSSQGIPLDTEDPIYGTGEESEALGRPVVPSTLNKKRAMTQHVVTRWYRAPELILLQHGYTEAIDIWSIGCIFAELLQMQEDAIRYEDRGPLFPGSSCFPLSPDRRSKGAGGPKKRGKNDQLEMIFSVIGTPAEEEIIALENEDARKYVRSFHTSKGEDLAAKYPSVGKEALELMYRMLKFSPKDRCSVADALAHPLLASVRDPAAEITADSFLQLGFDDTQDMEEAELRRCFGEELRKFQATDSGAPVQPG